MTDITTYPLEDGFETELSQVRDGSVGTIYVNATPSFTFPAGVTTYIIVDPGKSTMQLAKISAYNSTLKTITVSSISVNKGASVAYTQQSHQIGAKVRISHNYQFWKDMIDGINSKMNTNSDDLEVGKFADATARDAYRPTPVNGYSAYLIDVGYWTDYQSGNRVQRASGGSFSNATESISGGTETGTTAEVTAGTAIGGTGASLSVTPAKLAAQIQSGSYISLASATDSGTDTYVTTATPTLTAYTTGALFVVTFAETNTTTTPTLNIDGLGAVTITDKDSVALAVGDITTNKLILMKEGSAFKIMSELPATATRQGITTKSGGTSADGALSISSGTTTLAIPANGYLEKNYTSINITGGTLNFTGNGIVVIKCSSNFTMSAGTIDLDGIGGTGGTSTLAGSRGLNNLLALHTNAGGGGGAPGAGTAGALSLQVNNITNRLFSAGAGGGGGAAGNGGAGGAGGGLLIVECAGKINISGGTIRARGIAGSNGTSNNGGGGGGGGGGAIVILGTVGTITGTLQANGGNGGNGSGTSGSANGGGGGGGGLGAGGAGGGVTVAGSSGSVGFAYPSGTVTGGSGGTSGVNTMGGGGGGGGGFIYVSQY